MKLRGGVFGLALFAISCAPATAREIWVCHRANAPEGFPSEIEFWIDKQRHQVLEMKHLPYAILQDNSFAIVAISSWANDYGGSPFGPGDHYVGEDDGPAVRKLTIWAETLEIDRKSGQFVLQAVELAGKPIGAVQGTCKINHRAGFVKYNIAKEKGPAAGSHRAFSPESMTRRWSETAEPYAGSI